MRGAGLPSAHLQVSKLLPLSNLVLDAIRFIVPRTCFLAYVELHSLSPSTTGTESMVFEGILGKIHLELGRTLLWQKKVGLVRNTEKGYFETSFL